MIKALKEGLIIFFNDYDQWVDIGESLGMCFVVMVLSLILFFILLIIIILINYTYNEIENKRHDK